MDLDAKVGTEEKLPKFQDDTPRDTHEDEPMVPEPQEDKGKKYNTVADAEDAYSHLQQKYNQRDNEIREGKRYQEDVERILGPLGGPQKAAETLNMLKQNTSFRKWAEGEQHRQAAGNTTGEGDLNEAEQRGMQIVDNRIDQKLRHFEQSKVNPYIDQYQTDNLNTVMKQMDKEHPDWNKYTDEMGELAKDLDPRIQANPTFDQLKRLYDSAKLADKDLKTTDEFNQEIQRKKAQSTDEPPVPVGEGELPKINSIEDAYNAALSGFQPKG